MALLGKAPVWNTDPKLKLLPAEGVFGRMRGWPASPSDVFGVIDDLYILPDMVAKAVGECRPRTPWDGGPT